MNHKFKKNRQRNLKKKMLLQSYGRKNHKRDIIHEVRKKKQYDQI